MRKKQSSDVLHEFVSVFAGKGLLEQTIRIKYHQRNYRIFCSDEEFFAYRINDHYGVSPGFPGWTVCHVTHDEIVEDPTIPGQLPNEPGIYEWLNCLRMDDFEII
jgi:hypothetical protein